MEGRGGLVERSLNQNSSTWVIVLGLLFTTCKLSKQSFALLPYFKEGIKIIQELPITMCKSVFHSGYKQGLGKIV